MMMTETALGRMCLASRRGPDMPMLSAAVTIIALADGQNLTAHETGVPGPEDRGECDHRPVKLAAE